MRGRSELLLRIVSDFITRSPVSSAFLAPSISGRTNTFSRRHVPRVSSPIQVAAPCSGLPKLPLPSGADSAAHRTNQPTPTKQGLSSSVLQDAADAVDNWVGLRECFIVVKNGFIVHEQYYRYRSLTLSTTQNF